MTRVTIFHYRKPPENSPAKDRLEVLRNALAALQLEPESPRIADLKRILADRIAELNRQRRLLRR